MAAQGGIQALRGTRRKEHMRRLIIICLLLSLLGAAAVTYWSVADDPTLSDMELLRLAGTVEVVRGGETIEVGDKLGIRPGDQIATYGDESGARLRLQGDREIELGADSGLTVTGATAVTGRAGSFLADAGEPTTVAFGDVEASTSDGLFRVDVGYGSARRRVPGVGNPKRPRASRH